MSSPRYLVSNGPSSVSATIMDMSESWPAEGGPSAVVTFQCRWADRYALAKALKGGVSQAADGSIVYLSPFRYPPSPNLRCLEIGRIEGKKMVTDQETGWPLYELAVVPAVFSVPTWQPIGSDEGGGGEAEQVADPSGRPWVTTTVNCSAEVVVPPKGTYYFADETKVPDGGVGIILPQCEVTFKRMWMPYLPLKAMMALIGAVNAAPMRVGDYTFPRGTLLFANGPSQQDVDVDGVVTTNCEYKFLGRGNDSKGFPIEWNMLLSKGGDWQYISTSPDGGTTPGQTPFRYADFTTLP